MVRFNQYNDRILPSMVYSWGPLPGPTNSGVCEGLVRGPFVKMNRLLFLHAASIDYYFIVGGWGIPTSLLNVLDQHLQNTIWWKKSYTKQKKYFGKLTWIAKKSWFGKGLPFQLCFCWVSMLVFKGVVSPIRITVQKRINAAHLGVWTNMANYYTPQNLT